MFKNIFILLIFSFILLLIFFIIVESTNLFNKIYNPGGYNFEDRETYLSQGFTNNYYMQMREEAFNIKLTKFEEYFLISPEIINNEHVNITDYYNSRKVTNITALDDADYIIWFFGGSTMIELGTEDNLTITSTVAEGFKNEGKNH